MVDHDSRKNTLWQTNVRRLLGEWYGTEDIAVMLNCDLKDVQNEVVILREIGDLAEIYRKARESEWLI